MEKEEKLKGASTLVSFYLAILMIEFGVMAWLFSLFGGEFMFFSGNTVTFYKFASFKFSCSSIISKRCSPFLCSGFIFLKVL
jgi:hypothetical protein